MQTQPGGERSSSGKPLYCVIDYVREPPGVAVLHFSGDLDDEAVRELADLIDQHFNASWPAVVLDFTGTGRMGRAVVEMLTTQAGRAGEADIGFYLVVAPGCVGETLAAASGRHLFDVNATVAGALRAATRANHQSATS